MTDNKTSTPSPKQKPMQPANYVKTFRRGAIAANVFRRTAPGGFEYLDFSLSRAWKTPAGKEGYSQSFFPHNDEALLAVIAEACDWIRETQATAPGPIENDGPVRKLQAA